MAFHVWTGQQIRDTAGAPVNGGKLRIYTANTTSLANVYSDASLSTPLANPVPSDSLGYLPDIFLSDSTNYDCAELTAVGGLIRAYDDVPALGSDGGTFVKDFTGSRYQLRNSAGVLQREAGDPSPDNSGGKMRDGGWNGTQGDEYTNDFAESTFTGNVTIDGDLRVGGADVALDSIVGIGTASAVATVDIPLTGAGQRYRLEIRQLIMATGGGNILARFAFDSVPTFKVGAADYVYVGEGASQAAGYATAGSTGATSILLNNGTTPANTDKGWGMIDIVTPASNTGSWPTFLESRLSWQTAAGSMTRAMVSGSCGTTYGKATYIRLLSSAGNISFQWRMIKMNGFS
jgi:hypothetical protein